MSDTTLTRIAGGTIIGAALVGAGVTAAELVTAPYNPHGSLLIGWDAPLHVAKYLAMLALLVSMPIAFAVQRVTAGRLGFAGLVLVLFGLGAAATPYNILEVTLDPSQPISTLQTTWDMFNANALLGVMAGIGFLGVIVGIVLFALASRRTGGPFRVAGTVSLVGLAVAFVQMFVDVLPGVIPHGPTWMLLTLAGYGVAVWRRSDARQVGRTAAAATGEAARV